MNVPFKLNKYTLVRALAVPALLGLVACDSGTLADINNSINNGEDVNVNISSNDDGDIVISTQTDGDSDAGGTAGVAGGVFAMTNILEDNTIVAYARADDGTLTLVGEYRTGGRGGDFDGAEGLDPLISAYSMINTPDNNYLLAVNAGSNNIAVMQINDDMSLELVDIETSVGTGPNSLTYNDGLVYVSNIDADGEFQGEPDQEGSIFGFTFSNGDLTPIEGSRRDLPNRPSAVRFTPDGSSLLVTSINAGSSALATNNEDSILSFNIGADGLATTFDPISGATSTLRGNTEGRNLPSAIGFDVVDRSNGTFAVVTEAREFRPSGLPPIFPELQTGSVSVYQVSDDGAITASQLDLLAGQAPTVGQRTACWIVFSPDGEFFWVSNAVDASISTYRFTDASGNVELVEELAAIGVQPTSPDPAVAFDTTDGWIDLDISDDGEYIYQLFGLSGAVGVYAVDGGSLELVEIVSGDLPEENTQGIVAF